MTEPCGYRRIQVVWRPAGLDFASCGVAQVAGWISLVVVFRWLWYFASCGVSLVVEWRRIRLDFASC